MGENATLLELRGLRVWFPLAEGTVRAVNGIDFTINRGQTVGLVGESGCGKSLTARSILRIVPAPGRVEGQILYHRKFHDGDAGEQVRVIDLNTLDPHGKKIRSIRGAEIALVFQEPMTSLSPIHTIGDQITEAITLHLRLSKEEARQRAIETLIRVGMAQPEQVLSKYSHELSGGMRQRAMIAMGLSCNPSLLIADEPTTALDVTTQAQILELLKELQSLLGMAIIHITHDLGVIAEMADKVIVMYLGTVVEKADVVDLFYEPMHPYTQALLKSVPKIGALGRQQLQPIKGMVPDPYTMPPGCPFHPRCPSSVPDLCDQQAPPLLEPRPGHQVRCCRYATDRILR